MKLNYLWNFFVFFILIFYLKRLIKRSKKAIHTSSYEKLTENPSILFCVSLIKNCKNKLTNSEDFKKSKYKNETMNNLICHLKKNVSKNPNHIIKEAKKWNFFDAFNSRFKNTIRKIILMHNYRLCANYDLVLNPKKRFQVFKFNLNQINVKVFIYPAKKLSLFIGIELFTFDFNDSSNYISSLFIKQVKINSFKYEKKCHKIKKKNILKCFKIYCYQNCFKNKKNSHKFFYIEENNFSIKFDNKTTNPLDLNCLKKCYKDFHGTYYYLKEIRFKRKKSKEVEFVFDPIIQEVTPKYLMTKELFAIEFLGLLSILLGFNYLNFFLKCVSELVKLLKIRKNFLIEKIEIFIFIFVVTSLLFNCSKMIKDYKKHVLINTSTSLFPIENIPFSVSVCFNIEEIIDVKNKSNLIDLIDPIEKNNILTYETYTLKYENLLNNSYIKFLSLKKKVNLFKNQTSVFYISEWSSSNILIIYKCFLIYINVTQNLIQNLLEVSYINLKFNKKLSFYYLTAKNYPPNSKSYKIYPNTQYKIYETDLKGDQSIFNCKTYKEKCFSRQECIDECFVSRYISKFSKLPPNVPILLRWYEKKWYNLLSFHLHKIDKTKLYKNFKNVCYKTFSLVNCYEKEYKPTNRPIKKLSKKIKIFLHNISRANSKVVVMNKHELFTNILTSINIWLGLNIPRIIKFFFFKFKEKIFLFLDYRLLRNSSLNKSIRALFNFLFFIGLVYNLIILTNSIKNQSKITSVKYKLLTELEYPFITICLEFKNKYNLSKDLKLSGDLLDEITFSANDVFQSITFLDDKFFLQEQKEFNNFEHKKSSKILKVSHFYFMNLKCYKVKYKFKLPFYYFYRKKNDSTFLTINLKPNITFYYLTLSTKKSYNFNHYKGMIKQKSIIYFYKVAVVYKDFYTFLKDFFHFFKSEKTVNFNEGVSYSNFLKKKFKEQKNFSTLLLPLSKKYFNLTINDEEFLDFYKTKMVKLEKKNIDNNYIREHFTKTFSHFHSLIENQLKFKPKFLSSETTIRDKIPVEHFFLIFLNTISFWFDISLINFFDQSKTIMKSIFYHFSSFSILIFLKIRRFFFR